MAKNSMIFYYDWLDMFEDLDMDEIGRLTVAMLKYDSEGIEPDFSDDKALKVAWRQLRASADANRQRYEETCERNRENGKKGGRPPKNPSGSEENPKNPLGFSGFLKKPTETQKNPISDRLISDNCNTDILTNNNIYTLSMPDYNDILKYFTKQGQSAEASKFEKYYRAKGWTSGGKPIKSWQKLADAWIANIRPPTKAHNFSQRQGSLSEIEKKIFNQ